METIQDLVFDVGFHRGEDSRFYLRKGFRVVAFEANPALIQSAHKAFPDQIKSGQLRIVEGAITDDRSVSELEFYVFDKKTEFGTTSPYWAERNDKLGFSGRKLNVRAVNFAECLERFGVPYYCKIDIEGADRICLRELTKQSTRPRFVSIESDKSSLDMIDEEFDLLEAMGYNRFALVQQATIGYRSYRFTDLEGNPFSFNFAPGSSGPFGTDLKCDWLTRSEAREAYERVFERYRKYGDATAWQQILPLKAFTKVFMRFTGNGMPGWYDTHATRL